MNYLKNKKGFGVLELLLAGSIFILLLTSIVSLLLYSRSSVNENNSSLRALLYAEEGIAAINSVRDENFSELIDGTHGIIFSGGKWSLSGEYDEKYNFKREILISTIEEGVKNIRIEITWNNMFNKNKKIYWQQYFTKWTEKEI